MKSKITLIIAAFAILISFAFISVNKAPSSQQTKDDANKIQQQSLTGFAMEDKNQWD